jgi:hypothetical protein
MLRFYAPFAQTYCTTLGNFTPGPFWAEQKQNWDHLTGEFLQFGRLAPWVPFFAAAFTTLNRRRVLHIVAVVLAVFGALYSTTIGHCYWKHYFIMAFAGAAVLGVVGAIGLQKRLDKSKRGLKGWVRAFLLISVYFTLNPRYEAESAAKYEAAHYGGFNADTIDFVRANTAPGDIVFTTGTPFLNVLSNRLGPRIGPSAIFDELLVALPGKDDEERLAFLRAELENAMPRLIYLDPDHEGRRGRCMRDVVTPFMQAHGYREARPRFWMLPD